MKFFLSTITQLNFWGYKVYRRLDKIQQIDMHDGLIWRLELKSWVKWRRESSVLSLHPLPCHSFKVLPFYTLVFLFSFVTFLAFWRASYHVCILCRRKKQSYARTHESRGIFLESCTSQLYIKIGKNSTCIMHSLYSSPQTPWVGRMHAMCMAIAMVKKTIDFQLHHINM